MFSKATARRARGRRGQSLVEYLLMTAMLATLSMAFSKFYGKQVLGAGLMRLPNKVGPCISNGASASQCQ